MSGRGSTLKGWNKWNQQLLEAKHPIFSDGKNRMVSGGSFSGEGREAKRPGQNRPPRNGEAASGRRFRCGFKRGCEQHDDRALVLPPVPTCCEQWCCYRHLMPLCSTVSLKPGQNERFCKLQSCRSQKKTFR